MFVIGCDSFLSLRNVRNGKLGRLLDGLHVLVDPHQLDGSKAVCPEGCTLGPLVDFDSSKDPSLARLIDDTYTARKAFFDGWTLWIALASSSFRNHPERPLRRTASLGMAGVRFTRGWLWGAAGSAQRGRRTVADALGRHPAAVEYREMFRNARPAVVAGFSPEGPREMLLVETARAAGIRTAVMVRSRDNLSAKIHHMPRADRYLVWSEATKSFFLKMYPEVEPEDVVVTGSPQFDRHRDSGFALGREELFGRVGLDPARPLVVYTMATPGLIDLETDIVQHLADAAHARKFAGGAQLLVRGHPRMFGSNLPLLAREYDEAKCYPKRGSSPYRSAEHEAHVVRLILEDEPVHLATLACQDVQVNVCGTMTIDSAIYDKPTVNVYYDIPRASHGFSVRRFYERSDVKEMMAYGASRLARSPEECIALINRYLEDPTLDAAGRRRAREEDCGPLDGRAGARIAEALKELAA
ncbi:MAG: hypothetical protein HY897_06935 [Deltaproteobacteria bacterium]|nr:hypothetical protein [Deltaproteobacteria bacterium]